MFKLDQIFDFTWNMNFEFWKSTLFSETIYIPNYSIVRTFVTHPFSAGPPPRKYPGKSRKSIIINGKVRKKRNNTVVQLNNGYIFKSNSVKSYLFWYFHFKCDKYLPKIILNQKPHLNLFNEQKNSKNRSSLNAETEKNGISAVN